jgi:hypothetical protein
MMAQRRVNGSGRKNGFQRRWYGPAIAIPLLCVLALPAAAQDKKNSGANKNDDDDSIGFIASKNASAKEVGLPLYPGSQRHKDESNDSPALQLGAWGGSSGFKLVVLKMESTDAPEKVTAFYHKALGKYGKVLNCTDSSAAAGGKDKGKSSKELDCESDHPDNGEVVLKAGTKQEQHIASIKPNGTGSFYDLVYVEARGGDNK